MIKTTCFVLLVLTGSAFFYSCDDDEEVIPEDLYETVFTELTVVNQMSTDQFSESDKEEIRNEIFSHYQLTEEEFRLSHEYYEGQGEQQIARMDSISLKLRQIRDEIDQARQDHRARLDSLRQAETDSLDNPSLDSLDLDEQQ